MRWLKVLLCLVACVVVFMFATALTIRFLLNDAETVPCPDVTGLQVEEARRVADRLGLSVAVLKYENRKDAAYNQVLTQVPDPTTPVRVGRGVSVVLSAGPRPTEIPELIGLSLEEAQAEANARGLPIKKVIYVPSESIGKVLGQAPSSGMNILDEEGMVLIAGGQERRFFMMPDIAVGDLATLMEELEKKHIKYSILPIAQAEVTRGTTPKSKLLPRTIFDEDTVVELPANVNGGQRIDD